MDQDNTKVFYKILETIAARAKTGLAFPNHPYDILRYEEILKALDDMYQLLAKDGVLSDIISSLKQTKVEIGSQEYVTPKVAVATAVFNKLDEVLLVKRMDGIWALPGGYADIPFDPIENAKKEVREETGLDVTINSIIGVYDSNINNFPSIGRQVYLLVFLGNLQGGTLIANRTEIQDATFYNLRSLPEIWPITLSQIEYGYRMYKGEILPTIVEQKAE
jgi:ADP-ribose pyrophosphatase YjhB (NUDIX family)